MRDDDDLDEDLTDQDLTDEERTGGRILQSGIRSEDEIEPAEYALPRGVPALQDRGDDEWEEDADPEPRPDRRRFLGLATGGFVIGIGSYLFGRNSAPAIVSQRHRRLGTRLTQKQLRKIHAAQTWAVGETETLVAAAPSFLWVFRVVEPDETLLKGLWRLCDYSLTQGGGKPGFDVAVEILGTFEQVPAPPGFERLRQGLEDVTWRWQVKQRTKGY